MTPAEVKDLSDTELRIKVAELCGFTDIRAYTLAEWYRHEVECDCNFPDLVGTKDGRKDRDVPDYPYDLNAMSAAEEAVMKPEVNFGRMMRYVSNLELLLLGHRDLVERRDSHTARYRVFTATARQRAEAFVLTMEGA